MSSAKSPSQKFSTIIMAAGLGKRMYSKTPKILHTILGKPIIQFVVDLAQTIGSSQTVVVVGPNGHELQRHLGRTVQYAVQSVPRGTGDAVHKGLARTKHSHILILSGDVPLLSRRTLQALIDEHYSESASLTFLTCRIHNPAGYGRIVRDRRGKVVKIVEDVDATSAQKKINEINAGIYLVKAEPLRSALQRVTVNNRQGEYYLTDIIRVFLKRREKVIGYVIPDENEIIGINTKTELARVRDLIKNRWYAELMKRGVWIEDPATTTIDLSVKIGENVRIRPYTMLEGRTRIPDGQILGPFVWIRDNKPCGLVLERKR